MTLEEVTNLKGRFNRQEMFTFILNTKVLVLPHGFNHKMLGKNISGLRDINGRFMVKDVFRIANTKGCGWECNLLPNPITLNIEPNLS